MNKFEFEKLKLNFGDYIWILNEKGEGFWGNYNGGYEPSKQIFTFRNHSNGKIELIEIFKLQRLQKG